jgi:hypothetical protein
MGNLAYGPGHTLGALAQRGDILADTATQQSALSRKLALLAWLQP